MPEYHVVIKVEETIVIDANSEEEAIELAHGSFDPSAIYPKIVEVWSNDE